MSIWEDACADEEDHARQNEIQRRLGNLAKRIREIEAAEARGYARGKIDGYKSGVEDAAKMCDVGARVCIDQGADPQKRAFTETFAELMRETAAEVRSLLPPGKEG